MKNAALSLHPAPSFALQPAIYPIHRTSFGLYSLHDETNAALSSDTLTHKNSTARMHYVLPDPVPTKPFLDSKKSFFSAPGYKFNPLGPVCRHISVNMFSIQRKAFSLLLATSSILSAWLQVQSSRPRVPSYLPNDSTHEDP